MEYKISSFLENENYNFDKKEILNNLPEKYIEDAVNTITTWDNYKPTSIKNLDLLANNYSVKNIYYKDEGERFDLKSFKALGGAFAVDKVSKNKKEITVATATAGNHGRSVAWGAKRLGIKCKIFISENVSEERAEKMRKLNADVIRVKGNYEASLNECIKQSKENNWEIVQDVSWQNYKTTPQLIMAGYTLMVKEIKEQINIEKITHVFLQAGVGGMAAAVIAGFAKFSKNIPQFIIVEPETADCVFQSIKNKKSTIVDIKKESLMGGMSCESVSTIAWEILKNSCNYCLTVSDEFIAPMIAMLNRKKISSEKIISGECGVPGVISLKGILSNEKLRSSMNLNSNSNVLLIGCEGLTDEVNYEKLLSKGIEIIS